MSVIAAPNKSLQRTRRTVIDFAEERNRRLFAVPLSFLLVGSMSLRHASLNDVSGGATVSERFPSAAPEIPVDNVARAAVYYEKCLGFHWDWGVEGIGQVSRGGCRLFLTDNSFRQGTGTGTTAPVVIWINLNSRAEVDGLHGAWSNSGARIVAAPDSKPWNLHEFTAADLDGNLFRVFYDFAWELPDRGGRVDDTAERAAAHERT